jgi:hypothetical protein
MIRTDVDAVFVYGFLLVGLIAVVVWAWGASR